MKNCEGKQDNDAFAGGMQDWNYVNTNCFEITIELGCVKYPKSENMPPFWDANKYSLLVFIGQVRLSK